MDARAASSSAVLVCQGRASADGRFAVGRFSDPVARSLLDPGELRVVDRVRSGPRPRDLSQWLGYEVVRRTGLTVVPRTVAIDDAVRAHVRAHAGDHASAQLVILGTGLDTRAWRMTELSGTTVFEVDHPASQGDKLRRVDGLVPTAARVVPVSVDLARERIAPALERAGFDRESVSTWVWEGVVLYLRPEEVRSTVGQVAQLAAPASRLVVNYQARTVPTRLMRPAMRLLFRLVRQPDPLQAEPWRSLWRPKQLRGVLAQGGFAVTSDEHLLMLADELDLPSGNRAALRSSRVAIAERR